MVAQVDAIGMRDADGAVASMWLHKNFLLGVDIVKSAIKYKLGLGNESAG